MLFLLLVERREAVPLDPTDEAGVPPPSFFALAFFDGVGLGATDSPGSSRATSFRLRPERRTEELTEASSRSPLGGGLGGRPGSGVCSLPPAMEEFGFDARLLPLVFGVGPSLADSFEGVERPEAAPLLADLRSDLAGVRPTGVL